MSVTLNWPDRPTPIGVIGSSVRRVEGAEKVTGRARYAADLIPATTLWIKVLRSPHAHARITGVDASLARALSGVRAVLTGEDVPSVLLGAQVRDMPVLTRDVVRYRGDRVAAVAAETARIAEEAVGLIDVTYEELPTVFDQLEAEQPDAPSLHPHYAQYRRPPKTTDPSLQNVQSVTSFCLGDAEQGFAESDVIFEGVFRTHMVHQGFIEPRCCTVDIDSQGVIHVWISDQAPYKVRENVATVAECPEEGVVVHPVLVGGSFGAKDDVQDAPLAYLLAKATGRPVCLCWTYAEELQYGNPRHPAIIRLKTGLKRDGRLWAREGQIIYNGGAYASMKPNPEANLTGGLQLGGSYRIPHTRLESRCVYTNQVPCGYMRSPGETQVHFAVESHMDMIAHAMGMDPLELRLLNSLQEGDVTPNGLKVRDVRCYDVLRRAAEASNWGTPFSSPVPDGKLRGRGIALGDRHTGTSTASTKVVLEPDGTVTLVTVLADVGPGAHTIMVQIVAETLGVPVDQIHLERASTDRLPFDLGVKGASATYSSGTSVQRSTLDLIEQLKERAAGEWGVQASEIRWEPGRAVFVAHPDKEMTLEQLARLNPDEPAAGSHTFKAAGKPDVLSFQAHVAEVAVDPETGEIDVERFVSVYDVGRVLNPITHQGQLEGAFAQGLGYALMEALDPQDGKICAASLGEYKLPTIKDLPPLHVEYVQTGVGPAPFQSKGAGETGLSTVAPAIANAVFAATGVRVQELPLFPETILKRLEERRASLDGVPARAVEKNG